MSLVILLISQNIGLKSTTNYGFNITCLDFMNCEGVNFNFGVEWGECKSTLIDDSNLPESVLCFARLN